MGLPLKSHSCAGALLYAGASAPSLPSLAAIQHAYDLTDVTTLWQDSGRTIAASAANDPIMVIDDLIGSQNLVAPSTGARPFLESNGGQWSGNFDGSNDALASAGNCAFDPSLGVHFFVVVAYDSSARQDHIASLKSAVDSVSSALELFTLGSGSYTGLGGAVLFSNRGGTLSQVIQSTDVGAGVVGPGTGFIIEGAYLGGGNARIYHDFGEGTALQTSSTFTNAPSGPAPIVMGNATAGSKLRGVIAEMVICDGTLDAAGRTSILEYLNAKHSDFIGEVVDA